VKVSIITAVYNNSDSILDAIGSVRCQTYGNIEHIIVDGASTDGTTELIEDSEYEPDVFISEPDEGIYDALNKGIANATGDIIGFLHSDDIFASEKSVETIVKSFRKGIDTVYGDLQYVRKENSNQVVRYWKSGEFSLTKLKQGWMPPHPTVYLRREIYEKYGTFDISFRIAADYEYMLRIFSDESRNSCHIPDVLVKMRVGGESNTVKNYVKKWKEDFRAMEKNNIGGLGTLIMKNVCKLNQFFT